MSSKVHKHSPDDKLRAPRKVRRSQLSPTLGSGSVSVLLACYDTRRAPLTHRWCVVVFSVISLQWNQWFAEQVGLSEPDSVDFGS